MYSDKVPEEKITKFIELLKLMLKYNPKYRPYPNELLKFFYISFRKMQN